MKRFGHELLSALLLMGVVFAEQRSQVFSVNGNVRTVERPVSYASVTFMDKNDTSKNFSTVTDNSGNYHLSITTEVSNQRILVPQSFELAQNYPNPFSSSTAISYKLNKLSEVKIKIYDILGREVRSFITGMQQIGTHGIVWDGTDHTGNKIASGIYFYRLQTKNEIQVKKMIFLTSVAGANLAMPNKLVSPVNALEKEQKVFIEPGTYTVRVKNTDSTQPKISIREFYSVTIQRDTTLNFVVKESTHYNMNLYVGNWGDDQVYVIDTDSDAIIDTLTGFGSVWDITPTKSGKKLYVATRQGPVNYPGVVYSVDLQTKSKKQILSQSADVYIEPNGTPLIIASTPYGSMRHVGTIDTVTDAISYFDTLDIRDSGSNYEALAFHSTESIFYTTNNRGNLIAYDYAKKEVVHRYQNHGDILNIAISKDNTRLYSTVYSYTLVVLDLAKDIVVTAAASNHLGTLVLGKDERYLYVTDPGKYILPAPIPSGKVYIFQTSIYTFQTPIDVNKASGQAYTITDRIVIAPDGKKAYVSDSIANIFVIDLETNVVVDVIRFEPRNITIRPIALGVK